MMTIVKKSRQSLDGPVVTIRKGLAIYKILASPYYFVRIRDSKNKKNIVKSTKETSRIEARKVAEEIFQSLNTSGVISKTPNEFTFGYYANQVVKQAQHDMIANNRSPTHVKDIRYVLEQKEWGLLKEFKDRDIREIQTKDFFLYASKLQESHPNFSDSTHQQIRGGFRKVMLQALKSGVIVQRPEAPKINNSKKSTPRTFFKFYPLVPAEQDEYKRLCSFATKAANEKAIVRGTVITTELKDLIQFMVNSFLRPTYSELFALKHSDITRRNDWLVLNIRKGKTGKRITETMPAAANIYDRMLKVRGSIKSDDYVFFPEYENRKTAHRVASRQLNYVLEKAELKHDKETGRSHSLYSCRHLALAYRVLNSSGNADLLLLAQNSGTSLAMLEQFYLRNLPRPEDAIRRLQTIKRVPKKE